MTKYVLNSGGVKNNLDKKRRFHQELIKGLSNQPKFVLCNFAQGREYWESKFEAYREAITEDMPKTVTPTFELALPDHFEEQCKSADVIYFHGGDDSLLQYWMKQYQLDKLFKDKVVATNSASSNLLATHYWTCDWRACADGMGLLPIKFIPHYKSQFGSSDPRGPIDWDKAYKELEAYGDTSLPIHALKEGDYVVIEA